jgi:hypothetical protein
MGHNPNFHDQCKSLFYTCPKTLRLWELVQTTLISQAQTDTYRGQLYMHVRNTYTYAHTRSETDNTTQM